MLLCQALAENMLVDALSWANPDQSFPLGSSSSSYEVLSQVGKNLSHFYRWGNCGPAESVRNTPKINSDIFFLWQSEESSSDLLPCSGGTLTTTPPSFLCKPRAGLRTSSPNPVAPAIPQREKQCPGSASASLKCRSETQHNTHISCRKTSTWSLLEPPTTT